MKNITNYLIITTTLLIPTYLLRFDIFGVPSNVLEILVLATFISYLARGKYPLLQFYGQNKVISWSVLAICAGLLVSTLTNDNWRAGFGIIKGWFAAPIVFAWVVYASVKTEENLKSLLKWLYLGIFGVAAISLGYYFSGSLTYDGRLSGIYNSPNFLAMYLVPGVIIGLYLMQNANIKMKNDKVKLKNVYIFYLLPLIIIIVSLYLTFSYAAWAAAILSLIITYLIKNRRINKRAILVSAIIILLISVTQWNSEKFVNLKEFSRSSLESRIMIWQAAGKMLSDNPLWGIGPGNFQNKYLEYQKYFPPYLEWAVPQPHNLYLAFWLQTGLIGLAGFIVLIFMTLKKLISLVAQSKNGEVAAILLAILLYVLIHGLPDTPYWKNDLALFFWLIAALSHKAFRQFDL